MSVTPVEVAVAVVRDAGGHVLLAERTARQRSAGFWELPGGKIEPGETPAEAARRELAEEAGIEAASLQGVMRYPFDFPAQRIRLHVFAVTGWRGTPFGREGQRLTWVDPAAPHVAPILPSIARVMTRLSLPPSLRIVDLAQPLLALFAQARAAQGAGATILQLRAARLAPDQKIALARRVVRAVRADGVRIMLAGTALHAMRAGADGVHSDAVCFGAMQARPDLPLWSVAARDVGALARAAELGADFAIAPAPIGGPPLPLFALAAGGVATLCGEPWHEDGASRPPSAQGSQRPRAHTIH